MVKLRTDARQFRGTQHVERINETKRLRRVDEVPHRLHFRWRRFQKAGDTGEEAEYVNFTNQTLYNFFYRTVGIVIM